MKLEALDSQKVLDIIVTSRAEYKRGTKEYYCVWEYRPWSFTKRPFIQLIADQDLPLYPGQHTRISGEHIHRDQLSNPPLLFIDSVDEDSEFVIKRGQTVAMMDPEASKVPNASYATWIKTPVNNTMLMLGIPILAFGRIITDRRLEPDVTVTRTDPLKDNRRGYFLYAHFPNVDQPALRPSFAERLASAR